MIFFNLALFTKKERNVMNNIFLKILNHHFFSYISDFPDDIDSFTIDVFNGAKRAKPIPLCRTTLLLERLPNGVVVDQWYQLIALTSQGRGEMGSIRTRAQFLQETLMPLEEYKSLQEVRAIFVFPVFYFMRTRAQYLQ